MNVQGETNMKTLKTNKIMAAIAALIFVFSQIIPVNGASAATSSLLQTQSVSTQANLKNITDWAQRVSNAKTLEEFQAIEKEGYPPLMSSPILIPPAPQNPLDTLQQFLTRGQAFLKDVAAVSSVAI